MPALSRTAVYVAAGRAVGAREPDPDVCNPDYLAERLLGRDLAEFDLRLPIVRALDEDYAEARKSLEVMGTVRGMAVRTRFIDEALERGVAAGATQLLILGAGLDSHAYRCGALLRNVRVFEVDRPVMQAWKRQRVNQALGGPPANLAYVAVDFETDVLRDVLQRHGYDFGQRAFVIMEGLTMYLHETAARETLSLVAAHPAGSSVVFDFVTDAVVASLKQVDLETIPEPARRFMTRFLHLLRDEPWEFGLPIGKEREYLDGLGFEVGEILDVSGAEAARRYLTRADGTELGAEAMQTLPDIARIGARAGREASTYRICEAVVPRKH